MPRLMGLRLMEYNCMQYICKYRDFRPMTTLELTWFTEDQFHGYKARTSSVGRKNTYMYAFMFFLYTNRWHAPVPIATNHGILPNQGRPRLKRGHRARHRANAGMFVGRLWDWKSSIEFSFCFIGHVRGLSYSREGGLSLSHWMLWFPDNILAGCFNLIIQRIYNWGNCHYMWGNLGVLAAGSC